MAVLINRTQKNFTMISNSILRDKNLSLKDRGLLCTICSLPDKWEFSIAGVGGKVNLPPHGKEFFHAAVSTFLHPTVSTFLHPAVSTFLHRR